MADKPTSIRLNEEELKKLDELAKKENVKRSVVLKKAVLHYLSGRPEATAENNIPQRIADLEKKTSTLLTRVDILTTQIDKILNRIGIRK